MGRIGKRIHANDVALWYSIEIARAAYNTYTCTHAQLCRCAKKNDTWNILLVLLLLGSSFSSGKRKSRTEGPRHIEETVSLFVLDKNLKQNNSKK